jgi:hypothetical protein
LEAKDFIIDDKKGELEDIARPIELEVNNGD